MIQKGFGAFDPEAQSSSHRLMYVVQQHASLQASHRHHLSRCWPDWTRECRKLSDESIWFSRCHQGHVVE
jgi:hypothetical protein